MDFGLLRRAAGAALVAGLLAGTLLTAFQQLDIAPLILEAERHEHDASAAQTSSERLVGTAIANVSLAIGFALLLAAAMTLHGSRPGWRAGTLWGLAGFIVFFAAPALVLPPELPGMDAAPLALRQAWWVGTAVCSAAGLALLASSRRPPAWIAAAVLLLLPHVLGAQQLPAHHLPGALVSSFIAWTSLANAVFWLVLGVTTLMLLRPDAP